jgi:hypothetical protein
VRPTQGRVPGKNTIRTGAQCTQIDKQTYSPQKKTKFAHIVQRSGEQVQQILAVAICNFKLVIPNEVRDLQLAAGMTKSGE